MAPTRRAKSGHSKVKKTIATRLSAKLTRQGMKKKTGGTTSKTYRAGPISRSPNKKQEASIQKDILPRGPASQSGPPTFDTWLLQNLSAKQQAAVSKDFREKINKVGTSLLALAAAKKELVETDSKVAQLEETYGRTMKVQDVWQYQERAGLAAIIGQDPQAVMNAPHIFKEEERLMYNSAHPRANVSEAKTTEEASPSRRQAPQARTRSQWMHNKDERLSTDDEDD